MRRMPWNGWAIAAIVLLAAARPAMAVPATIRTGGPSFAGDAKRAIVLAKRSLAGRPFTVTDASGAVVLASSPRPPTDRRT